MLACGVALVCSSFRFVVPHFGCALQFTLVDATTERKLGNSAPISIFSLLQRQADNECFKSSQSRSKQPQHLASFSETSSLSADGSECSTTPSYTSSRSTVENYFGTLFFSSSNPLRRPLHEDKSLTQKDLEDVKESPRMAHEAHMKRLAQQAHEPDGCDLYPMRSVVDVAKVLGQFEACVRFKENYQELFLDSRPQLALQPPEEAVGLHCITVHIPVFCLSPTSSLLAFPLLPLPSPLPVLSLDSHVMRVQRSSQELSRI